MRFTSTYILRYHSRYFAIVRLYSTLSGLDALKAIYFKVSHV